MSFSYLSIPLGIMAWKQLFVAWLVGPRKLATTNASWDCPSLGNIVRYQCMFFGFLLCFFTYTIVMLSFSLLSYVDYSFCWFIPNCALWRNKLW